MEQVQKPRERLDAPRPNHTGIPGRMKRDFERRSGLTFDDVRVHYNSDGPARLGALAYTRGTQVYLGPGQERYLPHELGHVVQQKTRPVPATRRGGGVPVNDDPALEAEADRWGAGADMGGPAVQLYQGQDVAQCVGERLADDDNRAQLYEIYACAAAQMPDLTQWKNLGFFDNKSIDGWFGDITLKEVAARAEAFRTDNSPNNWMNLKEILVAAAEVDRERFVSLFGMEKGDDYYTTMEELRELCARTEQVVESLWVLQKDDSSYLGLLEHIELAKRKVIETVRLVGESWYGHAYFDPREFWLDTPGGDKSKGPPPKIKRQSKDRILAPVPAPDSDSVPGLIPGEGDHWTTGDFEEDRKTLLARQKLLPRPGDTPEKWFELQTERGGAQQTQPQTGPQPDMPGWWDRAKEAMFGCCCGLKTAEIKHRYGLILQGLNWLSKDPYLKVWFYPEDSNVVGQTYRSLGKKAVIELWGAYMKKWAASDETSRPSTLIHELSHSFADTTDHAYGEDIKTLSMEQALENADTYACAAVNKLGASERQWTDRRVSWDTVLMEAF